MTDKQTAATMQATPKPILTPEAIEAHRATLARFRHPDAPAVDLWTCPSTGKGKAGYWNKAGDWHTLEDAPDWHRERGVEKLAETLAKVMRLNQHQSDSLAQSLATLPGRYKDEQTRHFIFAAVADSFAYLDSRVVR